MIRHELTFASRMQSISDPHLRDNLMNQLMASYARLDIPAIMEKASGVQGARACRYTLVCACIWSRPSAYNMCSKSLKSASAGLATVGRGCAASV